jgi:hypothetical protein
MSTLKQGDYGGSTDSVLVPGSLIAYRHFALDGTGLQPMSLSGAGQGIPYFDPLLLNPYHLGWANCGCSMCRPAGGTAQPNPPSPKTFRATCLRQTDPWSFGYSSTPNHKAPHVECTCGFYASYDPRTDFYPGRHWSIEENPVIMSLHRQPIVRAVVELSGTTVMGSRGVRAEKMRIVALATDWLKYQSQPPYTQISYYIPDYYWNGEADLSLSKQLDWAQAQSKARQGAEQKVSSVAYRYGAEYFTSMQEMHRTYPQPDISHLKGTTDGLDAGPGTRPEMGTGSGDTGGDLPQHPVN